MILFSQQQNHNLMLIGLPPPTDSITPGRYPIELVENIKRTYVSIGDNPITMDSELTKMAMAYSEQSLKEDWDNEDDAYWQSYLK